MTNDKKHRLAAIVFTDIVGYTKRMEKDEQQTMQLLQQQREIVFPIVETFGGKVIKEIGDGLLIMFESAIQSVRCTIAIQKRLKGVNEALEIFEVLYSDNASSSQYEKKSIFNDLWERRVIHFFAAYIISSWIIIQVVSFFVSRYLLSPYLIDFTWVIFLSLIPTVLLLTYFHGKPGRNKWTKLERIGVPGNFLLTILLLFFIFKSKDLGAATTAVTIENEQGEKIERIIVKSEFRKKTAIFFFENETNDSTLNWLQYAISTMIDHDLSQDIFNLIDELTLQLKKDLGIPESHLEEVYDLPLSEIFTNSFTALENFTKGNNLIVIDNNWSKGTEYIEKAIKEDAGFTLAYLKLAEVYFNTNQVKKAKEYLKVANDIWKDADPEYKPAQKAKEKLVEIKAMS